MPTAIEVLEPIVTISNMYRWKGDEWDSYDLTLEARGKSYPVASLTVYDSGSAPLVIRASDLRTVAQRKAWDRVVRALGATEGDMVLDAWNPCTIFQATI